MLHGCPKYTSTGPNEHKHLEAKKLVRNTNQQIGPDNRDTGHPRWMQQLVMRKVQKEKLLKTRAMRMLV